MENKETFNVEIIGLIDAKIADCKKVMNKDVKYMTEGFDLFFTKEAHELYLSAYMNKKLVCLKESLLQIYSLDERNGFDVATQSKALAACAEKISDEIEFYTNLLLNGEVMSNTTNLLYNIAHLYDREVNQSYLKFIQILLKRIQKMGVVA